MAGSPLASAQQQKKYALLIGINIYTSTSLIKKELKFAKADALGLEEVLESRGWDTVAVVDEAADRRRIIRELHKLALKAGPSDKVLIYFAGHGVRDPRGKGTTYWVPTDATVENLVADGIRLNHILEYVNEIGAQEKIVILDHCYSGDFDTAINVVNDDSRDGIGISSVTVNERDLFPEEIKRLETYSEPRLVILAAARGPAYEDDDWEHGMFTKAILDTLANPQSDTSPGDGKISLGELWTALNVAIEAMAAQKNVEQKALSNALITQMNWQLFDAAVENFEEEAQELTTLLAHLLMEAHLEPAVVQVYRDVIANMEADVAGGVEPTETTLKLIQVLRSARDLGVSQGSAQVLKQEVVQLGLVEGEV